MDDVLKMKYYFNQHHSLSSSAFSPNDCRVRAGRGGCAGGLEAALTGDDFSAPRTATVSCLWTAGRKHIWSQTADPPRPLFTASPLTLHPPALLFVSIFFLFLTARSVSVFFRPECGLHCIRAPCLFPLLLILLLPTAVQ